MAILSVVLVVAIAGVLVGVKLAGGGTSTGSARQPAPAADVTKMTSVPLSTLASAAVKGLQPAQPLSDAALTSGGKPELLYIGAEYCPVCATERWPLIVALSHFGTFANLSETHSSVSDGDIPTFSFYGATFTSPYLTFTSVETTTNQPAGNYYKKLETPTSDQMALWQAKDGQNLTFPFIDIGGKWFLGSSQFPASALIGASFSDILNTVGNNSTSLGRAIDASAAALTRYICSITGQQPAQTCHAVG